MIVDRCKDIEEFKIFYEKYANERIDTVENVLSLPHFCFYDEKTEELLGCIYLEMDNGLLCLSGFSKHKQMDKVIEAITWVSNFMHLDNLYSHTNKKCAKIVLLKCGFKKINDELFLRKAF